MNRILPIDVQDSQGKTIYLEDCVILTLEKEELYGFIHQIDGTPFIRAILGPNAQPGRMYRDYPLSTHHHLCRVYDATQSLTPFTTADELYSLIAPYTSGIYFEDAAGTMLHVNASLRINHDGEVVIRLEEKE